MSVATLTTPEHHRRDRERLQHHIRDNLADPALSVASSSAALFMSVRYAQKVFAQAGLTPKDWLLECRMGEARRLLATTDLSVVSVARRVGYRESPQFSRAFKARVGVSPGMFRTACPRA